MRKVLTPVLKPSIIMVSAETWRFMISIARPHTDSASPQRVKSFEWAGYLILRSSDRKGNCDEGHTAV